jgi:hypothetical protein
MQFGIDFRVLDSKWLVSKKNIGSFNFRTAASSSCNHLMSKDKKYTNF